MMYNINNQHHTTLNAFKSFYLIQICFLTIRQYQTQFFAAPLVYK